MPDNIIAFDGTPGQAARINYSVPMPGSHTGRRITKLEGIADADWQPSAIPAPEAVGEAAGVVPSAAGTVRVDEARTVNFLTSRLGRLGVAPTMVGRVREIASERSAMPVAMARATGPTTEGPAPRGPRTVMPTPEVEPERLADRLAESVRRLRDTGTLVVLTPKWGGGVTETEIDPKIPPKPALFIVEFYGVSLFLGDYGLA